MYLTGHFGRPPHHRRGAGVLPDVLGIIYKFKDSFSFSRFAMHLRYLVQRMMHDKPLATISHYELPYALVEKYNGWASRELIGFYMNYCETIFERYKDKVKY